MFFTKAKRSQGALEFLMTYGWAFLVIIIMITALAYFGILNPGRFLPDRCMFSSPFSCETGIIKPQGNSNPTIILSLKNDYGAPIDVQVVDIATDYAALKSVYGTIADNVDETQLDLADTSIASGEMMACFDENDNGACDINDGNLTWASGSTRAWDFSYNNTMQDGEEKILLIHLSNNDIQNLPQGKKVKFYVTLAFKEHGKPVALLKQVIGELYVNVEKI